VLKVGLSKAGETHRTPKRVRIEAQLRMRCGEGCPRRSKFWEFRIRNAAIWCVLYSRP